MRSSRRSSTLLDRRVDRDGARAAGCVPGGAATAAAGAGADGGGAYLRPARPDRFVDRRRGGRRAAGACRLGRGLCDPVSRARRPGDARRRRRADRRDEGRQRAAGRRCSPPRWRRSPRCWRWRFRRCRWCAASVCCWWSAWRSRSSVVLTAGFATLGWAGGGDAREAAPQAGRDRRRMAAHAHALQQASSARAESRAGDCALCSRWSAGRPGCCRRSPPTSASSSRAVWPRSRTPRRCRSHRHERRSRRLVKAKDVTDPKVIEWMRLPERRYWPTPATRANTRPAPSPSSARRSRWPISFAARNSPRRSIRQLLDPVGDFSRGVVSPAATMATIAFGLREEVAERPEADDRPTCAIA